VPPVQTNATLTKVTRGGFSEEPGASKAAVAGAPVFEGSARVYYQEKRERRSTPQGLDVTVRRILKVDTRDPAIEFRAGDTVEFEADRKGAMSGEVQDVTEAELGEMAGSGVETTHVELEPK
jgi:hypothetical protein